MVTANPIARMKRAHGIIGKNTVENMDETALKRKKFVVLEIFYIILVIFSILSQCGLDRTVGRKNCENFNLKNIKIFYQILLEN